MDNRIFENLLNMITDTKPSANPSRPITDKKVLDAIHKLGVDEGIIVPTPDGVIVAPYPKNGEDMDSYIDMLIEKSRKKKSSENKHISNENEKTESACCCGCCNNHDNDEECDDDGIAIKRVIYNDRTTILLFDDGTKTITQCSPEDTFDPISGLAIALCKKLVGNRTFHDLIKEFAYPEYEKRKKHAEKNAPVKLAKTENEPVGTEKKIEKETAATIAAENTDTDKSEKPKAKKKSAKHVADKADDTPAES